MYETLVRIPHAIGPLPVFGAGWALMGWIAAWIVRMLWLWRSEISSPVDDERPIGADDRSDQEKSPSKVGLMLSESLFWAIAAGVIWKVLPAVELRNVDDDPVGLAVRGYGVFLLCGVVAAVALAAYRAKRFGLSGDIILQMAPWAFFGGIFGARLFYIVQYRERFYDPSPLKMLANVANFTEGGLVVYGSFIGGGLALLFFILRHRLPVLRLGDVVVPSLFIGVFFGRMGCLMYGCCWGGACEPAWYALRFPQGSPAYRSQLADGTLVGLDIEGDGKIAAIANGSLAEKRGVRAGEEVTAWSLDDSAKYTFDRDLPASELPMGIAAEIDGRPVRFRADELPPRALPLYPAQVISSLGSLLLCLGLSSIRPHQLRDGTIMWLGFIGYALLRFVLELVRADEAGQFGTSMSISQWVSVVVIVLSLSGWFVQRRFTSASDASGGEVGADPATV